MLETFTAQTFAPYVGETFLLIADDSPPAELKLVSVTDLQTRSSGKAGGEQVRLPFSLLFKGQSDLHLPQRIYHLEHKELGAMDIFLVPVGPEAHEMRYEAVFG